MYHADREIRDRDIIKAILDMCDVVNVGFYDDEYPYVLPFNFGYEYGDDLVFYLHHATEGYKNKLIAGNPNVCATAHRFIDHIHNDYDNSGHDYRCVMAFGTIETIPRESDEYARAWEVLCRCNGRSVPAAVFAPDFNVLMTKITCRAENVIGKAQRKISSVSEVPFAYHQ